MNRIGIFLAAAAGRADAAVQRRRCSSSTSASGRGVRLGEIKEVVTEPGLKFKLPPPFQNVVFLDKRIRRWTARRPGPIFTAEKKNL